MITQMIYKGTNFKGECGIYGNQEREGSGTSNRTVTTSKSKETKKGVTGIPKEKESEEQVVPSFKKQRLKSKDTISLRQFHREETKEIIS